jgi:hypothetical protein
MALPPQHIRVFTLLTVCCSRLLHHNLHQQLGDRVVSPNCACGDAQVRPGIVASCLDQTVLLSENYFSKKRLCDFVCRHKLSLDYRMNYQSETIKVE